MTSEGLTDKFFPPQYHGQVQVDFNIFGIKDLMKDLNEI